MATNNNVLLALYAETYVRAPEKAGFDFWTSGIAAGTQTLQGAADLFAQRPEWVAAYPATMTNAAYVDQIYLNVLGIAGDTAGRAFWTAGITSGAYTKTSFLVNFTQATLDFVSTASQYSTLSAADVATATTAQGAMQGKVNFSNSWVSTTAVSTSSAVTGADSTGKYTASLDQSVKLLAGVTDATSSTAQQAKIAPLGNGGSTFTLTTGSDSLTNLTALNDTITGGTGTLGNADVIVDNTTTDADVLTAQATSAVGPTIKNIETINITDVVAPGLNLTTVTGTNTLNLSATVATNAATATVLNAKTAAVANIVAGANIGTLVVSAATTGTGTGDLAINAGNAGTVVLTGSTGTDSFALTTTGNVTIKAGSNQAVETLKLTANSVSTPTATPATTTTGTTTTPATTTAAPAVTPVVTLDSANALLTYTAPVAAAVGSAAVPASGGSIQILGTSNLELKADISNLSGRTVTNAGSGQVTVSLGALSSVSATQDLSKIAGATINLTSDLGSGASIATPSIKVAEAAIITTPVDQSGLVVTGPITATVNDTAAKLTSLNSDTLKVLTVNSAAAIAAGTAATAPTTTYGVIDLAGSIGATPTFTPAGANLTGTKVVFTGGTTAAPQNVLVSQGAVETVDASALVGTLTYTDSAFVGYATGATVATATSLVAGTTEKFNFTGSAGNDKLIISAPSVLTAVTGVLTPTVGNSVKAALTVNLGAGDDSITLPGTTFATGSTLNIDGGTGTNTLILSNGADVSAAALNLANIQNIAIDPVAGGTVTLSAAQVSGQTYAIKGSTLIDNFKIAGASTTTTVDLTKLAFDSAVENVVIDGSKGVAAQTLSGVASLSLPIKNDITGGAGADTIIGGAGADIIVAGSGADVLTGGLGADKFVFNNANTFVPSATAFDTITDFVKGTDTVIGLGGSSTITDGSYSARNSSTFVINNAAGTSVASKTAAPGIAGYSVNSVATFDPSDITLSQHINAIAKSLDTATSAGNSVVWSDTGGTYLFISGGKSVATTGPVSGDTVVKLSGVSLTPSDALSNFVTGSNIVTISSSPTTGNDNITGTVGNDTLNGIAGNDTITGLGGDDTFVVNAGQNDTITDLGNGNDQLQIAATGAATATVAASWGNSTTTSSWNAGASNSTAILNTNGFSVDLTNPDANASAVSGWTVNSTGTTTLTSGKLADVFNVNGGVATINSVGLNAKMDVVKVAAGATANVILDTTATAFTFSSASGNLGTANVYDNSNAKASTIDLSAATGNWSAFAGTVADPTISGGTGAGVTFVGGAGNDSFTGSTKAADTFKMAAGILNGLETITNFENANGAKDIIGLSLSAKQAGTTAFNFVDANSGKAAAAGTVTESKIAVTANVAAATTIGATANLIELDGTVTNIATVISTLQAKLTLGFTPTASQVFDLPVAWSDGTNGYVSDLHIVAPATGMAAALTGDTVTATNLLQLTGITTVAAGDFAVVAFIA